MSFKTSEKRPWNGRPSLRRKNAVRVRRLQAVFLAPECREAARRGDFGEALSLSLSDNNIRKEASERGGCLLLANTNYMRDAFSTVLPDMKPPYSIIFETSVRFRGKPQCN